MTFPRDTTVTVNGCDGEPTIDMSFGDFLDANVDGIGDDEVELIALTLGEGMTYQGGGGAEARWTVKVAP